MSSRVVHVESKEEVDLILRSKYVVIDFSAKWCGPCKKIAPKYDAYSKYKQDVVFVHFDIDELQHPESADVSSVPTFKLYRDGRMVDIMSGADMDALKTRVNALCRTE